MPAGREILYTLSGTEKFYEWPISAGNFKFGVNIKSKLSHHGDFDSKYWGKGLDAYF